MMRPHVTKSSLALCVFLVVFAGRAHAEERCTLRGEAELAPSSGIYDAPSDGTEIGHFTGAKVALSVLSFAEGAGVRSLVETTGFRIKGFVRTRDITVFTTRAVPVLGAHLSIGEGRRVSVIGAAPGRLRIERTATSPIAGVFQGWAPCEALSLATHAPPGWTPPGGAHGYLATRPKLDLFDHAKGDVLTTLARAPDAPGIPLWAGEGTDGFVHVEHHGDLVVDAWARLRDLTPLPQGETFEQAPRTPTTTVLAKLQLQGRARIVRTTTAMPLRAAATEAAVEIGGIDAGVDVVLVDVVAGWASVMPTSQAFAPSGAAQFWVRARDLGV